MCNSNESIRRRTSARCLSISRTSLSFSRTSIDFLALTNFFDSLLRTHRKSLLIMWLQFASVCLFVCLFVFLRPNFIFLKKRRKVFYFEGPPETSGGEVEHVVLFSWNNNRFGSIQNFTVLFNESCILFSGFISSSPQTRSRSTFFFLAVEFDSDG